MTADKNTRLTRLGRYARTTSLAGGLATKLVGEKLFGLKISRADHAAALTTALGNLRGPLMKVAQLLATIPDALPPEYLAEFQKLQAQAPSMGWPFVKRRMQAELGALWESKFAQFDKTAIAAASLGQVHKATMHSGQVVACKLQYPDMQSAVEADLRQLKLAFSIFESYDKSINAKYILHELSDRLYEELDYEREAKNGALYTHMLANVPQVSVPQTVPTLSGPRLLTSHWLQGDKILDFKTAPLETRNQLAKNLFYAWYVPFYHYGVIHGDPHLGNYNVRSDLGINLLDFGCIRVFPPSFVQGVLELYRALQTNDKNLAAHAFELWGFNNLSKDLLDVLLVWAKFLYRPLLEDKKQTMGQSAQGQVYGREIATKVHADIKALGGGVTVPREFVFMDRAALGLGSVFIHLQAEINWYEIFHELAGSFDVDRLATNQAAALKKVGL
jgi:predicted unusual protein kinase regulating ubiquinone biosynthesis (AarF/ABC1/UbiB family)